MLHRTLNDVDRDVDITALVFSVLSTAACLHIMLIIWVYGDLRFQRSRLLWHVALANFLFSATFIFVRTLNLASGDTLYDTKDGVHERLFASTFTLYCGSVTWLTNIETSLIAAAGIMVARKTDTISSRGERIMHIASPVLGIIWSAVLCAFFVSDCLRVDNTAQDLDRFDNCLKYYWMVVTYFWLGLIVPMIITFCLVLWVMGQRGMLKRHNGTRSDPHASTTKFQRLRQQQLDDVDTQHARELLRGILIYPAVLIVFLGFAISVLSTSPSSGNVDTIINVFSIVTSIKGFAFWISFLFTEPRAKTKARPQNMLARYRRQSRRVRVNDTELFFSYDDDTGSTSPDDGLNAPNLPPTRPDANYAAL
eukprot:m.43365 g.43365  ORF g.43365 m.43365 type:complete len:366 (-) comp6153_c0_seq1:190-1287(-)